MCVFKRNFDCDPTVKMLTGRTLLQSLLNARLGCSSFSSDSAAVLPLDFKMFPWSRTCSCMDIE